MYIFRFIIVIDWCQICLFIVFTSHKTNSLLPDYLLSIIVLLCGKPAIRKADIRRIFSQYLMDFRRITGKDNILCDYFGVIRWISGVFLPNIRRSDGGF